MSSKVECEVEETPLGKFLTPPQGYYIRAPKGLVGVIPDKTNISGVDPKGTSTIYRGYTIDDIGEHADFYEGAHLILYGHLPNESEYKEIKGKIDKYRGEIPEKVFDALRYVPTTHPMYYASYAVSLMGQYYAPEWKFEEDFLYDHALRLIAAMPVFLTAGWHLARHGTFYRPDPSLPHGKDVLRMIIGRMPSDLEARAFESTLVLYMDHGFNASTFTVRVVASTLSDIYSAIAAGIGALKGPLHGGANEKAMAMFLEAQEKAKAKGLELKDYIEEYIKERLANKQLIMGFGHRVYKVHDPRTDVAGKFIRQLKDGEDWLQVLKKSEEVMKKEKNLPANIDLYTGVLYYQLGIPIPMYTPIFAIGRVVGWSAHYIEQVLNNKIIRPTEDYVGPSGLKYAPISERK
ncbi:MAG: citrate/2-methylcitrate synthase [Caldisphaeraceae archaeon]|nr:citrate/2-methylcitrate synthase [Caldisphaeraceae archaeon]MEB3797474.1 citrate/2-methylcitrate synthase [Caldisphaeraceae archaeon]